MVEFLARTLVMCVSRAPSMVVDPVSREKLGSGFCRQVGSGFSVIFKIQNPFNPNSIGVKYSLMVFFLGGGSIGPCLCFDLLMGQKLNSICFEL